MHGHVGWLAVAALLHPALVLRRPGRRAPWATGLSTSAVVVTAALGATIYPEYRVQLKQKLFLESPSLGWCFERKEHLALFALTLAATGWVLHAAAPRFGESRALVERGAHRAYVAAFVLALATAVLGLAVSVAYPL